MNQILEIKYSDINPSAKDVDVSGFRVRKAARSVVIDKLNKVALLFVGKYNYHKLPGGGIDPGEDTIQALARELKEEIGCEAKVFTELGQVTEYINNKNITQYSYCYLSKIVGPKGSPSFTEKELGEGFAVKWVDSLDEAIEIIKSDKPANEEGQFIQKRDLAILEAAQLHLV